MTIDVLAYLRVSTDDQDRSGLGIDAQRATIEEAAASKGWNVVDWIEDRGESGKSLERPGIQEALTLIEDGGPDVLVAAKLDRLSRSAIDFMTLVQRAKSNGWALVILDLGVDMTTPVGKFVAGVMAQVAELERDMIRERTKAALKAAQRNGTHVGRPPFGLVANPEDHGPQLVPNLSLLGAESHAEGREVLAGITTTVATMRKQGATFQTIADYLNDDGVPTPSGKEEGYWSPKQVSRLIHAIEAGTYAQAAGIGDASRANR